MMALAHNGTITNASELRLSMQEREAICQTNADSEIVMHLMAHSREQSFMDILRDALGQLQGAFSLVLLTPERLIAVRDPFGFRPLSLGRAEPGHVVASETCAFDIIGAEYTRSLEAGEILEIDSAGMRSHHLEPAKRQCACIFEHIYFARPDSFVFGEKVDKVRRRLGQELAREAPCDADIVIAVPDSVNTAALGYARESGLSYEIGLIRNHYIGRTFIAPHQDKRKLDVRVKLNPVPGVVGGKRVVLVDDSIVRGTTMRQIVQLLRSKGAAEVHVRISSPPIGHACYYGIDISDKAELIASSRSIEHIRDYIEADSLTYISTQAMLRTVEDGSRYCTACFTGDYPGPVPVGFKKIGF